jgi:glutamate dehydrogenase/leucine dehydrogenase
MSAADLLPLEVLGSDREADHLLDCNLIFERAARALDLEDWVVQRLKQPEREITVNLPLTRDHGDAVTCAAFRVQHSRVRGACLGPVIFAADSQLAELRTTARHMSLQCALLELPMGGSAGALVCDPEQLSERELRRLAKDYVAALQDLTGPYADVLCPAGNQVAAWMLDSYALTHAQLDPAAVLGKPASLGGVPDPSAAIACGLGALIQAALQARGGALRLSRVAIQGFEGATDSLARYLQQHDALVTAVADRSGGLIRSDGIDLQSLRVYLEKNHFVLGYGDADAASNAEVLESACDVLVTAAAERQVNLHNAARVQAKVVLEAVMGAITPGADGILRGHDIMVVPDLLGTCATTLTWFAEWQQATRFAAPQQREVENSVQTRTASSFRSVVAVAEKLRTDLRSAAYLCGLKNLATAVRLRG